jgi:hypothetical protein
MDSICFFTNFEQKNKKNEEILVSINMPDGFCQLSQCTRKHLLFVTHQDAASESEWRMGRTLCDAPEKRAQSRYQF